MITTLFYLYGIIYLIQDLKFTLEGIFGDFYTKINMKVDFSDISKVHETYDAAKSQVTFIGVASAIITLIWIIAGLQTQQWQHFLFLPFIWLLTLMGKIDKEGTPKNIVRYRTVDVIGTILRISTVGIIYYKHFYN